MALLLAALLLTGCGVQNATPAPTETEPTETKSTETAKLQVPDFTVYDVQFLMINLTDGTSETVETASSFIAARGYSFPVLYDTTAEAANTYGIYSILTTIFMDVQGYGVAQATGAISGDTLQKGIDMITGNP